MGSRYRIRIVGFGVSENPLRKLAAEHAQATYLLYYLTDLGAHSVLWEQTYFDRDYLDEFASYYSVSTKGYSNRCERLHFFGDSGITRDKLRKAAGGNRRALAALQRSYLGFIVVRPIPTAPLGRTVLRWYPEQFPATPRITDPSREYVVHIAGLALSVRGLAWQQQDSAVAACATVALWSALHSSAFDAHHAIPTTAQITRRAHRTASLGNRVFPSSGLTIYQICEAIKESGMAPEIVPGDLLTIDGTGYRFSKEHFLASCASLIRSGFPCILVGRRGDGAHAVCAVGFRECAPTRPQAGQIEMQDEGIEYLYIHDDNVGPACRMRVEELPIGMSSGTCIALRIDPPVGVKSSRAGLPPDPSSNIEDFYPSQIVAAVHENIRTSVDAMNQYGLRAADELCTTYNAFAGRDGHEQIGLTLGVRHSILHEYLGHELPRRLGAGTILAKTRLGLSEQSVPMSLFVSVVRIGWGATPLADILIDTTDCGISPHAFCAVSFHAGFTQLLQARAGVSAIPDQIVEAH